MYYNVLVLLDGSDTSEVVLQYVPSFVSSSGSERVTLFQVAEQQGTESDSYLKGKAERLARSWDADLTTIPNIETASDILRQGSVADVVIDFAAQNDVDMIMLATRGWSGADWWITGSVAQSIIRDATVPVFAARLRGGRYERPGIAQKILLPLDGSLLSEQAIPYAAHIATNSKAELTLLYVAITAAHRTIERTSSEKSPLEVDAYKYLNAISDELRTSDSGVVTTVRNGNAGQQIAEMAQEENFDLIVMSSHGHTGPGGGAFGGVTEGVIHGCHTPILVIPHRVKVPGL